jgi:hypothetical protein
MPAPLLAHAGGLDEFLATILVAAGFVTLWVGISRLRGRGFPGLPKPAAFAFLALAPVALVAAVVVPWWFGPKVAPGPRPASTATIEFVEPRPGRVVRAGMLPVDLRVDGGRIVARTTTDIRPDTGHVHLYLDGRLLSMTYGAEQEVPVDDLQPGVHRLLAEFVAADHAPFDPRVTATVSFVKEGS